MSTEALQGRLGYSFADPGLLRQALTHRSHGRTHNERLEFLGDSVLNCAVAALLYERFEHIDEGDLSRLRATLVKQQSLYEIAQRLELSPHLLLGEGELKSGGARRPSILGDTLEAIVGAVYLDGGFNAARDLVVSLYAPIIEMMDPKTLGKDAKTLLQEHLQGRRIPLPIYSVVATHGAAHSQMFEVECAIPKLGIQVLGRGDSRRAAEQAAARLALDALQTRAQQAAQGGKRARIRADKSALPASRSTRQAASAEGGAARADAPSTDPVAAPVTAVPGGAGTAATGTDATSPTDAPAAVPAPTERTRRTSGAGTATSLATAAVPGAATGTGAGPGPSPVTDARGVPSGPAVDAPAEGSLPRVGKGETRVVKTSGPEDGSDEGKSPTSGRTERGDRTRSAARTPR